MKCFKINFPFYSSFIQPYLVRTLAPETNDKIKSRKRFILIIKDGFHYHQKCYLHVCFNYLKVYDGKGYQNFDEKDNENTFET